ncbi:MAG: prepilin-type N-terminal cleavage/methylation domain-containing protein [Proteobacteria bacterium]|nr:prepilin-type N-terminal cleavage/methylation domain-containing protein [Pseudomonadota bacterium]
MKSSSTWKRPGKFSSRGYTLIEVLVGMTIFALGMLALVHLQGNLARNSGDSNARTVANNIAEEVIESFRTFSQIPTDPGGVADAFEDIVVGQSVIERGGVNYEIDIDVTDYYSNSTGTFGTVNPGALVYADMKLLEVTVTWNTEQEFRIDETTTTSDLLGSGSIKLTDIISSITSPSGGKVLLMSPEDNGYAPIVDYNPGANPDIISIQLGQNKFKESTTPLPDVIRSDEMVETRFDVVTYSQDNAGATFLRREEFRAVSCECTLRVANANGEGGLRPTIWGGVEYSQAEFVAKPWGESAINLQSSFCSLCCRDHHDGGTGEDDVAGDPGRSRYDAFRSSENYYDSGLLQGDHKHYKRNNQGELTLADSDGDVYVEACRLVRKDGFFRVAQDLRQEGLNNFPASYLDDATEVAEYSAYVTAAVTQYEADVGATNLYELSPPDLTAAADMPTPLVFPASTFATASVMETGGVTEQQLRTRGIYLDYMSDDLRTKINCLDLGGDGDSCDVPSVTTALEIIPFYEVQLTWLARWNESPINDPVDVTNETIQDDNAHSRGIASLQSGFGFSTVSAAAHKGNLGLTATDPTDPEYAADVENKFLYVLANDPSTPPVLTDIIVTGTISSAISGLRASDVEISANNAQCDRTNTGYECILEVSATTPIIQFSNYAKANRLLVACSDVLVYHGQLEGSNGWTKFRLPTVSTPFAEIVIKDEADCAR